MLGGGGAAAVWGGSRLAVWWSVSVLVWFRGAVVVVGLGLGWLLVQVSLLRGEGLVVRLGRRLVVGLECTATPCCAF